MIKHNRENMIDISIIIPVYKGRRYINRLQHMIDKSVSYENLYQMCSVEVLFINDSPEEKLKCEYTSKYVKCYIYDNFQNMGIHQSRINGLKYSKGEYIIFLDQDDYINVEYLYSQWKNIKKFNADVLICNGWKTRFLPLWNKQEMLEVLKNIYSFSKTGNPIISPGATIIRSDSISNYWKENVMKRNGADDWFLWILMMLEEKNFVLNENFLFYHTPRRTINSISFEEMKKSEMEMYGLLKKYMGITTDVLCMLKKRIYNKEIYSRKLVEIYNLFFSWKRYELIEKQSVTDCFGNNEKIAIYGLGKVGECLLEDLLQHHKNVVYGIDRIAKDRLNKLTIYSIEDELPDVDVIIITFIEDNREIVDYLRKKINCKIINFHDLLFKYSKYDEEDLDT